MKNSILILIIGFFIASCTSSNNDSLDNNSVTQDRFNLVIDGVNLGLPTSQDVNYVLNVFKKGDIIQQIDGVTIAKFSDLKGFLNTKNPNDMVEVMILRADKQISLTVTLEKRTVIEIPVIGTLQEPEEKALKSVNLEYGLEVISLSENNRKDWESDGIYVGSFVTEINDISINSVNDAQMALEKYSNKVIRLSIVKNNGEKVVYRFR